eukprot:gnl/TRDRNA2_/TRDRNA2_164167_c0_seq1.p1 gnl/TRDRNA2_/TRDRNA2_164167_c0~~gnl/TRDRNA2_/TRDRNA2_164167_c0_seq1.p1  ORF type:complete len:118 (-),score=10.34 gnl/TRDRNA2_/TRDRNA2_164167_c0_seq1:44-397(-)
MELQRIALGIAMRTMHKESHPEHFRILMSAVRIHERLSSGHGVDDPSVLPSCHAKSNITSQDKTWNLAPDHMVDRWPAAAHMLVKCKAYDEECATYSDASAQEICSKIHLRHLATGR